MTTEPNILPRMALPDVIKLMRIFRNALKGQMQDFAASCNVHDLRHVIVTLKNDLELFINSFEHWHQTATSPKDYQLLEQLARELGEAQNLMCDAVDLVKTHNI